MFRSEGQRLSKALSIQAEREPVSIGLSMELAERLSDLKKTASELKVGRQPNAAKNLLHAWSYFEVHRCCGGIGGCHMCSGSS